MKYNAYLRKLRNVYSNYSSKCCLRCKRSSSTNALKKYKKNTKLNLVFFYWCEVFQATFFFTASTIFKTSDEISFEKFTTHFLSHNLLKIGTITESKTFGVIIIKCFLSFHFSCQNINVCIFVFNSRSKVFKSSIVFSESICFFIFSTSI